MKNILSKTLILILSFIVLGCEKEVDFKIDGESKLVVNCLFNPGNPFAVHVSMSGTVFSTLPTPDVENAKVILYEDEVLVEELAHQSKGIYTSTRKAENGKTYRLEVSADGLKTAKAIEKVDLEKVKIISAEYDRNISSQYNFTIKFNDTPGVKNYYILKMYDVRYQKDSIRLYETYIMKDNTTNNFPDFYTNGFAISDVLFDGKEYSIKIKSSYNIGKVLFELRNVSEGYYRFHDSYHDQVNGDENPFSNPNEIYNNVLDGLGVFGAFQSDSMLVHNITLSDSEIETIAATPLSSSTCLFKGIVTKKGKNKLLDHGFVYGYSSEAGSGTKVSLGSEIKGDEVEVEARVILGDLGPRNPNVRAYIQDEQGIYYGKAIEFIMPKISLSSITPGKGRAGDKVEIIGENFNTKADDYRVMFGDVEAKILGIESNRLVVEVPKVVSKLSKYLNVRLETFHGIFNLHNDFILESDPEVLLPELYSFSPTSGTPGTVVTIHGKNLQNHDGYITISFNDEEVYSNSVSDSTIVATVPENLKKGDVKIGVTVGGNKYPLPGVFKLE